jgi:hypothetical protein
MKRETEALSSFHETQHITYPSIWIENNQDRGASLVPRTDKALCNHRGKFMVRCTKAARNK